MPVIRFARICALVVLALAAVASADPPGRAAGPDPTREPGQTGGQGPTSGQGAIDGPGMPGGHAPFHAHGYPSRGRLGIEVQPMTPDLREFFSAPADRGVLVVHVEAGRAGQQAGLAVGDVLIAVAGVAIERPIDLIAAVARAPAGEKLPIELLQKGEKRSVEVLPEGGAIPEFADMPGRPAEPGGPDDSMTGGLRDSMTGGLRDSMTSGLRDSMTGGLRDSMTSGLRDSMTGGLRDSMASGLRGMPDLMRRLDDLEQRLERLERTPDSE